jgi:hypothetical protein
MNTAPVSTVAKVICVASFGLSSLVAEIAMAQGRDCPPPPAYTVAEPRTDQSISLKAVQNELRNCQSNRNCQKDVLTLYGVTQITGYVIHADAHDVILFGTKDPTKPALYIEDFIIALKNALLHYARTEGNVRY